MDDVLKLPDKLDVAGARALCETLLARRGAAVTIDASAVQKTGALAVEVLLSGARQWAGDGHPFRVIETSDALAGALRELDIDPRALSAPASDAEAGGEASSRRGAR